jgi:2-oxo-4-hydroxy-4-carboxy-5-ureidoimidazoline decarboxylase
MSLDAFNGAPRDEAVTAVKPCLGIARWVAGVVDRRPYADREELLGTARSVAQPFTDSEIELALAQHPRLGEQATGSGAAARMSAAEQASLGERSDDFEAALAHGHAEYERKFDRVFLIRAAGRSRSEILTELERRLANSAQEERVEVARELREIAVLRLEKVINS